MKSSHLMHPSEEHQAHAALISTACGCEWQHLRLEKYKGMVHGYSVGLKAKVTTHPGWWFMDPAVIASLVALGAEVRVIKPVFRLWPWIKTKLGFPQPVQVPDEPFGRLVLSPESQILDPKLLNEIKTLRPRTQVAFAIGVLENALSQTAGLPTHWSPALDALWFWVQTEDLPHDKSIRRATDDLYALFPHYSEEEGKMIGGLNVPEYLQELYFAVFHAIRWMTYTHYIDPPDQKQIVLTGIMAYACERGITLPTVQAYQELQSASGWLFAAEPALLSLRKPLKYAPPSP